MADFRKMFYASAIVALIACFTVPAGAQSLNCTDLHATNQIVRVEGWSELTGDIVLGCTGTGVSTAPGQPIAAADITVTIPQTQIASKLLNPASTTPLSEATLIIDDLKDPSFAGVGNYPGSRTHRICNDTLNGSAGVCQVLAPASPNLSYLGDPAHPNIFVGRAQGATQIVFAGVPLDPPGTGFTRTLRITNLRINATVFDPTNPFAQVVAIITFQGPAAVGLNNVQTTIATVSKGMGATRITADNTFLQCDYPLSTLAKGDAGVGLSETHGITTNTVNTSGCVAGSTAAPCIQVNTASSFSGPHPVIAITEGYQSSWKPRNMSELLGSGGQVVCPANSGSPCNGGGNGNDVSSAAYTTYNGTTINNPTDIPQNNPQIRYFTEGGFSESSATSAFTNGATGTTGVTIPYQMNTGTNSPTGATGGGAGTADWGTRIQFTLTSIPNGTVLSLPTVVPLLNGSTVSGVMVMITPTSPNGKGPFNATAASSGLASLQNSGYFDVTGPTASATYEVLMSDPFSTETAKIYPVLYFPALSLPTSVASDLPQANVGLQVSSATFAPYYATTGNQATTPPGQVDGTPRFIQSPSTPATLLTISRCTCSLLFPWVVSDSNYVTGIAVSNTSKDPTNGLTPPVIGYTAVQSAGKVQLYLFGTIGGTSAQTNTSIAAVYPAGDTQAKAGSYATFIVNTGFAGYAITQANFQYCHGLAFLFNATGAVPPVSYLGLVMDEGFELGRTTQPTTDALVH